MKKNKPKYELKTNLKYIILLLFFSLRALYEEWLSIRKDGEKETAFRKFLELNAEQLAM